ncbi:carboxypeptidase-like regulatory domain-containing protein [Maribacter chungangensis]|uniref:Carboxypeptidase-like regulatory domain-containing protein n=1 Tax=Maribacter chungangensis TaxID=1069117 RepID=A0ABW3B486_9FLAO
MKNNMLVFVCAALSTVSILAQDVRKISGTISDGNAPLSNVQINVMNTDSATFSDTEGKYSIEAETGDVITYTYMGMKTISIRVEDVTRILNPVMILDVNELDEVVVQSSKRLSQKNIEEQYSLRENIIKTAYGYLDAERSSGRIAFIQEDEITMVNGDIINLVVNGRLPGVSFLNGGIFIRGVSAIENPQPAIFDVDGQIFTQIPIWVDLGNVKRVAVLNNFANTTRYGSIASGGVIVINTFSGNLANKEVVDQAKLRNNFYKGDALTREDIKKNWPSYKKDLYASTSVAAAEAKFKELQAINSNSPYFVLDAQHYFAEKWDRTDVGDNIIAQHFGSYKENPVLLKALAYQYQVQGQFKKANEIYKEIFLLRPNYAQSYLDMARSYREIDSPVQSASIHARYAYLQDQGFMEIDTAGFAPIMEREFNNLLALEKDAVVDKGKHNKVFVAKEDFQGSRVVFEWNDGEAEFELQFVNPGKQFYTWKHSLADNEELISREKVFGFNVMEELIDGSLPGNWQINVTYLGNKSLTPTYLKATVYYNYGTNAQRKEVKVFKLSLKNVNQELFKVSSVAGLAAK